MTVTTNISDLEKLLGVDRLDAAAHREGAALDRLRELRPGRRPAMPWTPAPVAIRPTITIGKAVSR